MTERLENATNYLIDLLRAYGHRPITVKITQEGEEVDVMARTFVKRQLAKAGILFPHAEGGKPNTRKVNTSLDKLPEGSQLEMIEGGAHALMYEKPYYHTFQEKLIGFLLKKYKREA